MKYEAIWAASGSWIWTRPRKGAGLPVTLDNKLSLRIHSVLPAVQVARRAGLCRQKRPLPSSCLSVCLSARTYQRHFHWTDFWWTLFASELRVERACCKAQGEDKAPSDLIAPRERTDTGGKLLPHILMLITWKQAAGPQNSFRFSGKLLAGVMESVW